MTSAELSKPCTKCKRQLPISCYGKHRLGKYGRQAACKECDSARAKVYLKSPANLARRKATQADWYRTNRPAVRLRYTESFRRRRARHLVWSAATRAKRKGIPFSLGDADIADIQRRIDVGLCEITGMPFDLSPGRHFNSPSIDRIDSTRGYSPDNIRVVCHAMNAAMGDWGEGPVWKMFQCWLARKPGGASAEPAG